MGKHELWMGGVSDMKYFQRSAILKRQQQFVGGSYKVPFFMSLELKEMGHLNKNKSNLPF